MMSNQFRQSVRWADGSFDSSRLCDECGKANCKYPVHTDYYPEVITKVTYTNWLEQNSLKEDESGHFTQGK